jgi:pectate lyase
MLKIASAASVVGFLVVSCSGDQGKQAGAASSAGATAEPTAPGVAGKNAANASAGTSVGQAGRLSSGSDAGSETESSAGRAGATRTGAAPAGSGGAMASVAGSGGVAESAGTSASAGASGSATAAVGGAGGAPGTQPAIKGCGSASVLAGWSTEAGGTTGGDGGMTVSVDSLSALQAAVKGTTKQIIELRGKLSGDVSIGSNKTLIGCDGAQLTGHISLNKSENVIVRNLSIVGYNCSDNTQDCSGGQDAVTADGAAHHLWFDHDDISDGSDGNFDLTHAVDYVTVSWTKFHYSGRRTDPAGASGGHQFSNLVGHSDDNASEDTGHLRVTFHHDWWADNVVERMPRVRFGQVHLFDNLYTAAGNDYCVGIGNGANVLTENNVFVGVKTPIDSTSYADKASAVHSVGNVYTNTSGVAAAELNASSVFKPPYAYTLDATAALQAAIQAGAGPRS